jgi:uncharacterized protein YdaU (DUF1376 family)
MQKDPAFLFYSSDFLTGTMTMSNEQVGMYIRLLCLMHQRGKLNEKDMLNICKTYDEDVFSKFQKDVDGFYYNQRLLFEIQRRKDYSESRRNNRLKKNISKSYDPHMENENETVNIIPISAVKYSKDSKVRNPTLFEVKAYFKEKGYREDVAERAFEYYQELDWHNRDGKKVANWKTTMINNWFKQENKEESEFEKKMKNIR